MYFCIYLWHNKFVKVYIAPKNRLYNLCILYIH